MQHYLNEQIPFPWVKKGRVFNPEGTQFTHGSHPCAIHLNEDTFVVAFTRRDNNQRSNIFLSYARVGNGNVELLGEPKLAMSYGEPGHFDCDGAISVCLIEHDEKIYLYYVGWQNLPDGLWICDTGRAILDPHNLELVREFSGPVLGRDKDNPLFAAATAFHVSGNNWKAWYNSGVKWEKTAKGWHHKYGVHYAESDDGINWRYTPGMCIPFADEYEYAFGRPSVFHIDNTYYMWFAHRATKDIATYRIGFAYSDDGKVWQRCDEMSGIDVSESGWDSEMICYPYIFKHENFMYMFYNGNGYGKTGFGVASIEVD